MNKSPLTLALSLALTLGVAALAPQSATAAKAKAVKTPNAHANAHAGKAALGSFGVDLSARDTRVKPGDDFARYANGHWLDTYKLKDYESRYGSFNMLNDTAEEQVKAIVEELAARTDLAPGSDEQKVRDFYASFMNQSARDAAGIAPLQPVLARIAGIKTMADFIAVYGDGDVDGTNGPIGIGLSPDRKDPNAYLASVAVTGLGLPDKDYYFNADPRFVKIRAEYVKHIARMLGFAGVPVAEQTPRAEAILALETALAKNHWDRAQRRDRDKTYNVVTFAQLQQQYPKFDWAALFKAQGMKQPDRINITTPSAFGPVIDVVNATPINVWKDYLAFNAVRNNAPLLSKEIDEAAFAFNGTVLSGQTAQREPWKRAVALIADTDGLGDAVGRIYVAKHFKPESKAAMDELVENLRKALRMNIEHVSWMSAATKAEAYHKLETFRPKIGYTSKWRNYSTVRITPDNLVANARAMRAYYRDDTNNRVGTVPDREEWGMTPQTVNAYYNASFNEVVFPAAILQPPFFDVNADAAVNYGGIGAVIGHEMGHGFDDQGSKSDFAGIQRQWWTDTDRSNFDTKVKALGGQYDTYCPLPGQCVNGALTMGENIGDLGGLSMAYTAYKLSLHGKPAPVIDGLTGDQRFFLAWAQVWKGLSRDEALVNQLKSDPHSPPNVRINGPVRNLDEWYAAFNVKPGDKLYLAPEQRVRIW